MHWRHQAAILEVKLWWRNRKTHSYVRAAHDQPMSYILLQMKQYKQHIMSVHDTKILHRLEMQETIHCLTVILYAIAPGNLLETSVENLQK